MRALALALVFLMLPLCAFASEDMPESLLIDEGWKKCRFSAAMCAMPMQTEKVFDRMREMKESGLWAEWVFESVETMCDQYVVPCASVGPTLWKADQALLEEMQIMSDLSLRDENIEIRHAVNEELTAYLLGEVEFEDARARIEEKADRIMNE